MLGWIEHTFTLKVLNLQNKETTWMFSPRSQDRSGSNEM